jgi:tetratricopeptide (TPR) repeat protein
MRLSNLWHAVVGTKREPTVVQIFREASRHRDAGRLDEAQALVARGLSLEPRSIVGHLLAGNLHVALRAMPLARTEFERVLALDAHQPRALLGLGRIAFEENDAAACRTFLERALAWYPDFPEAQALLDVVSAPARARAVAAPAMPLTLPRGARDLVLVGGDGALLVAEPDGPHGARVAQHVDRVVRLADAIVARASLGELRQALIEGAMEITLLRRDAHAALSVTFPAGVTVAAASSDVDELWRVARAQEGETRTLA